MQYCTHVFKLAYTIFYYLLKTVFKVDQKRPLYR